MFRKSSALVFLAIIYSVIATSAQEIPIEHLSMQLLPNTEQYSKTILENEISGITVEHYTLTGKATSNESFPKEYKTVYLFIKGQGSAKTDSGENYNLETETILTPGKTQKLTIKANKKDTLHYLKISMTLTEQDFADLEEFPKENTQGVYFTKFTECKAYTEPIKSPKTVSRTVLPNKYLPRTAMGTVETTGPDKVDPHEHPMLEQLFLGLTNNQVIVRADDATIEFPAYSILHIPLGSSHSVKVSEGNKMYYMWMDFFMDKKGEEWLKTHETVEDQ